MQWSALLEGGNRESKIFISHDSFPPLCASYHLGISGPLYHSTSLASRMMATHRSYAALLLMHILSLLYLNAISFQIVSSPARRIIQPQTCTSSTALLAKKKSRPRRQGSQDVWFWWKSGRTMSMRIWTGIYEVLRQVAHGPTSVCGCHCRTSGSSTIFSIFKTRGTYLVL